MMKFLVPILLVVLFAFWQTVIKSELVADKGPDGRYINQLASNDSTILLFGGKHNDNRGFDDLWEWNGSKWLFVGNGATKRWDHSYVFMADELLLFGGRAFGEDNSRIELGDTWTYGRGVWTKLSITGPSPRSSHSMAYNEKDQVTMLFGGRWNDEILSDTWVFDGSWKKQEIKGPGGRYGHSLTYDTKNELIYLFGGHNGKELLNDFWKYDSNGWVEVKSNELPSPRMAHSMQFDREGRAVLFGGWDGNTASDEWWLWQEDDWKQLEIIRGPEGRLSGSITFDQKRELFVLFGGSTGFGGDFLSETWNFTLN